MQYRINDAEPIKRPYRGFNLLTFQGLLWDLILALFCGTSSHFAFNQAAAKPKICSRAFLPTEQLSRAERSTPFCSPSSLRKTLKGFKIALTENRLRRETEFLQRSKASLLLPTQTFKFEKVLQTNQLSISILTSTTFLCHAAPEYPLAQLSSSSYSSNDTFNLRYVVIQGQFVPSFRLESKSPLK